MRDIYANYVIQRAFEVAEDRQMEKLLQVVRNNSNELKKYTYGRHVVAHVEKVIYTKRNHENFKNINRNVDLQTEWTYTLMSKYNYELKIW